MKIYISLDHEPGYVRPLSVRLISDDGKKDKFIGIGDYSDVVQLQGLFRSWIQVTKDLHKPTSSIMKKENAE